MSKSKSSGRWLQEHFADSYVQKAQRMGYRSRASFKLLEIQAKDRLIKPGMIVVDLGAAPGGWSQVAVELVGEQGRVIASDILPMDALPGVEFIQGDFTESAVYDALSTCIGKQVDLVISDMAPNLSGTNAIDQPRAMYLVELALELAQSWLKQDGALLCKVFQGEGFDAFYTDLRRHFARVATRKPQASRARSREVYVLAQGFKR